VLRTHHAISLALLSLLPPHLSPSLLSSSFLPLVYLIFSSSSPVLSYLVDSVCYHKQISPPTTSLLIPEYFSALSISFSSVHRFPFLDHMRARRRRGEGERG
jgi:hypothetical protein